VGWLKRAGGRSWKQARRTPVAIGKATRSFFGRAQTRRRGILLFWVGIQDGRRTCLSRPKTTAHTTRSLHLACLLPVFTASDHMPPSASCPVGLPAHHPHHTFNSSWVGSLPACTFCHYLPHTLFSPATPHAPHYLHHLDGSPRCLTTFWPGRRFPTPHPAAIYTHYTLCPLLLPNLFLVVPSTCSWDGRDTHPRLPPLSACLPCLPIFPHTHFSLTTHMPVFLYNRQTEWTCYTTP